LARSRHPSRFSATVLKERLRRTDRTLNQQDRPNCWTLNQQDRPGRGRSPWQPLSKSCRVFIHLPLFSGRFTERGIIKILRALEQGPTEVLQPSRRMVHGERRGSEWTVYSRATTATFSPHFSRTASSTTCNGPHGQPRQT